MEHINFLESKKINFLDFNYLVILIVAGGLLLSFVIFGVVQKNRIDGMNAKLTGLIAEVEVLTQSKGTVPSQSTDVKTGFADKIQSHVFWAPVLNQLAQTASQTIRLKLLTASNGLLTIEGEGLTMQSVVQFKMKLDEVKLFKKVLLLSSQNTEGDGKERVVFKMECEL